MKEDKKVILKVLVGSRAHGLADENSDYDYRAVYVLPTSKILSLGFKYHGNDWIEGKEDNTAYEIGHFLKLATQCNPTILEVFRAPVIEATEDGKKLRELFPYVWNTNDAFNAFIGYGLNQRKKFLDRKDNRQDKYAVAYIRVLNQLINLLILERLIIEIHPQDVKDLLKRFKNGNYSYGEVIDKAEYYIELAKQARDNNTYHEANIDKVNEFLLNIRRRYW